MKAAGISRKYPEDLVLGADTVVACGGRILGKPCDLEQAKEFLRRLSGREHDVVTGVALLRQQDHVRKVWHEITRVTFAPLSEEQIRRYLELVPVLDKAGAYAVQEHGDLLGIRGHGEIANVIGLPLKRLRAELQKLSC